MKKHYFIAADQGGTKTIVRLLDESGRVLGEKITHGGCWFYVGIEASVSYLKEGVDQLLSEAGLTSSEVAFLMIGAAGINWKSEKDMYEDAVLRSMGIKCFAVNDGAAAIFSDGQDYPDRILLCAGTEFTAAIITESMDMPYVYCNEIQLDPEVLGGRAIGRNAVKAVLRAAKCLGEATDLTEDVLAFYCVKSTEELLPAFLKGTPPQEIQYLSPVVFDHAKRGDTVSQEILQQLAERMSSYAIGAIREYHLENRHVALVLAGGLFKADYSLLRDTIEKRVKENCAGCQILSGRAEPIEGACYMGKKILRKWDTER